MYRKPVLRGEVAHFPQVASGKRLEFVERLLEGLSVVNPLSIDGGFKGGEQAGYCLSAHFGRPASVRPVTLARVTLAGAARLAAGESTVKEAAVPDGVPAASARRITVR
jgi:hypothetical protein